MVAVQARGCSPEMQSAGTCGQPARPGAGNKHFEFAACKSHVAPEVCATFELEKGRHIWAVDGHLPGKAPAYFVTHTVICGQIPAVLRAEHLTYGLLQSNWDAFARASIKTSAGIWHRD
ncbi:hypothetical protein SPBR_02131 [Sporothrix brasiliensis 5110]|uniref:Uncharacterized protein n=1 Tax=Sporothrix brasiliensis 5110 TaxID=1398154 RepID=A0A0C2IW99_9PEZI|nr:uncharacterized protein SPBR_02131 [Sporothrix brasiliensis 5110]KIH91065.1 hypothetical protein SPBR_02131 [Sporothrix brasiliensis 5110]